MSACSRVASDMTKRLGRRAPNGLETDLLLVVYSELRLRRALLEPLCFTGSSVPAVTTGASSPLRPGGIIRAASPTMPAKWARKGSFEDVVTEESIASHAGADAHDTRSR